MSVSNGIITAPVSIKDVQEVLGETSNDLATLCKSSNINKWAKYKPESYKAIIYMSDDDRKSNNYGLINIPYYTQVSDMAKDVFANTMANASNVSSLDLRLDHWSYKQPSGGETSPYRMYDFVKYGDTSLGYYSAAPAPIGTATESDLEGSLSDEVSIVFDGNTLIDDRVLRLKDFKFDGVDIERDYLGLCLYDGTKYCYITQTVGYDDDQDVQIKDLDSYGIFFRSGKIFELFGSRKLSLKAFVFISTTPIDACTTLTTQSQKFYPLHDSLCDITITAKSITATVTCQAWKILSGIVITGMYGNVTVENTTDSNIYITNVTAEFLTSSGQTLYTTTMHNASPGTSVDAGSSFALTNKTLATQSVVSANNLDLATDVRFTVTAVVGQASQQFIEAATITTGVPRD